ncbi:MAG TPA: LytTR family DNA-binding domain-containing protein [Blastocatellia bacterium]|nr:LytTR family DNA-binding domain-containing protein [Blastocatellia bacterium]
MAPSGRQAKPEPVAFLPAAPLRLSVSLLPQRHPNAPGPQKGFVRVHRSTLINLSQVEEMYGWFGGRMLVRMKDKARTELTVARDQVKTLKEKMGVR